MQPQFEQDPDALPNGPARVVIDNKKDRFKLEYGPDAIFQGVVRLIREGVEMSLRDASTRLIVVSKFEGWKTVTQTVRVAVIGAQPDDVVLLRGTGTAAGLTALDGECAADQGGLPIGITFHHPAVYSIGGDWLLTSAPPPMIGPVEAVPARPAESRGEGEPAIVHRANLTAEGSEIVIHFLPYYRAHHLK
ncbi:MAG: hypothetical protein ACLQVD_19710 [Capsulimonadaceae bacterium]